MKNRSTFSILVVGLVILASSCAGNFHVEKRHYRNGFYVSVNGNPVRVTPDFASEDELTPLYFSDENTVLDSSTGMISDEADAVPLPEIIAVQEPMETEQSAVIPSVKVSQSPELSQIDDQKPKQSQKPDSDKLSAVPDEAHTLNTWWWIAASSLVVGIAAAILAFVPFLSPAFGVLFAAAPFLILGALGLSIWIANTARRRSLAAGNADEKTFYDKLKRRARVVTWISVSAIILFILFLALVIAALSTFT